MKRSPRIVIAGGGMVGLTLVALLTTDDRFGDSRLTLIDAGPPPTFDPEADVGLRVSALSVGSLRVLASLGASDVMRESRACPYREMRVWDARGSADAPDALHFDAAEFALAELGYIVENALVQTSLLGLLRRTNVELMFNSPINAVTATPETRVVRLDGDRELEADLLIGADGARSVVRNSAGIGVTGWNYEQKAFVTHARPETSHRFTAYQRFMKTGPIGLLPLQDGRVSLVWSTAPERAEAALAASDDELEVMLTDASDSVLGCLRPAGARGAFPLRAQYAANYTRQGLALVGDAAHSIHPLAGQGANLGIADAATLAEVVLEALQADEHPGDLPVLRRFERARKGANQTMLRFVDGLNRLFSIDAAPVESLRSAGMQLFNRSGPLKRRAVWTALGLPP